MSDGPTSGGPHPNLVLCPAHLQLNAGALADPSSVVAHATSLLLAGETFLNASRDECKSLTLRSRLEKAGLALIEEALAHRNC
jgi:hypothetical protein